MKFHKEDLYFDKFLLRCGYGIKEQEPFRRWMKKHKSYSGIHREGYVGQLYLKDGLLKIMKFLISLGRPLHW